MDLDLVSDTATLCRVCMTAKEGHRTDLFDASTFVSGQPNLHEMLKAICAPVFDRPDDEGSFQVPGMPTKVCSICRNGIIAGFKVHQMCIETDRRLSVLLSVKMELRGTEEEENGDPLGMGVKETPDDDAAAEESQSNVVQTKEEIDDSLIDDEHEEMIKVEEPQIGNENEHEDRDDDIVEDNESISEDKSEETCKVCSKTLRNVSMLRKHMIKMHQLYMCEFCPQTFESMSRFARHRNQHKKREQCSNCGVKFLSKDFLRKHHSSGSCLRTSYPCNFCKETFKVASSLRKHKTALHTNIKDSNRPFTCNACEESYPNKQELQMHKKSHHGTFSCSCGKVFVNARKLDKHATEGNCAGEKDRTCDLCGKIFENGVCMQRHRKDIHSEPAVCSECGHTMSNMASLRAHLRMGYCGARKEEPKPAHNRKCKICREILPSVYRLQAHMRTKHQDLMFRCDVCSMEFQAQRFLDLHKLLHAAKAINKCKTCGESFASKQELIRHRRTHRDPHKCTICGKLVATKNSLTCHMERHLGIKPFACDICPMRFCTKVEIKCHMLTHTKEHDHVCDLCGARFTRNHSLKKHVQHVHEGVRPFPCTLCTLKFANGNQLVRHMHTHTGEKPYKCELCPQAYAQTNDLVKHVARAHGDGGHPYCCDRCDDSFRLLTDLRQHYRVHAQSSTEEGSAEQMEEVRFTSVAILQRAFAKARKRQEQELN